MVELSKYIILLPCVTALIIGFFVKNLVDFIPNKFIPLICGVVVDALQSVSDFLTPEIDISLVHNWQAIYDKLKNQDFCVGFEIDEKSTVFLEDINFIR